MPNESANYLFRASISRMLKRSYDTSSNVGNTFHPTFTAVSLLFQKFANFKLKELVFFIFLRIFLI